MRKLTIAASFCLAASVFLASEARAGILYIHGTETAVRTNQGGSTYYDDIFFTNPSSFTDIELTSVTVGVRRVNPAPAVGVDVYAVPMTGTDNASLSGDLSRQVLLGSFSLGATTTTALVPLTLSSLSTILDLNNQVMSGFGGIWIGLDFTGANATNLNNGWRVVNAPAVGASFSDILAVDNSGVFTLGTFGGSPPDNLYVNVSGTLFNVPEPSSIALFGVGVLGMMGLGRRGRAASNAL